jgi:hypothetical protein
MVSFFTTSTIHALSYSLCCQPWKDVRYGNRRGHVKLPDINEMVGYLEKFSSTYAKYIVALSRYLLFHEK